MIELNCKSGRFLIDPRTGKVFGPDGNKILLRPKPMALLLHLAENIGSLSEKKDIFEQVWQGEIVSDSALRNALTEVRRAINDTNRNDPVIQTVPKRGYILNKANEPMRPASPPPPSIESGMRYSWPGLSALLSVVLLLWAGGFTQSQSLENDIDYCEIMPSFKVSPSSEPLSIPFNGTYQPDVGDFSIEVWFRHLGSDGVILDQRDEVDGLTGYALVIYKNQLLFQLANEERGWRNFHQYGEIAPLGIWRQAVISVDRDSEAGGLSYLDAQSPEPFSPVRFQASIKADAPLFIGKEKNLKQSFEGEIGLIRFYNRALTQIEVQRRFEHVKATTCDDSRRFNPRVL